LIQRKKGIAGDWLLLDFGSSKGPYANLILRDDWKCPECIDVQVPDTNSSWRTVEILNPRDFWSMEAVNLTQYLPVSGRLIVRLLWTQTHRLDFVGLDTSPPVAVNVSTASLKSAVRSALRNVTSALKCDDENKVVLTQSQQITLVFLLPSEDKNLTRDFILYTEGYYT
jgi:hypothetical protein